MKHPSMRNVSQLLSQTRHPPFQIYISPTISDTLPAK